MRTIKFRQYNKEKNDFAFIEIDKYAITTANTPFLENSEDPQQFTSLYDKNGKEIYEGDIIEVPYNRIGNLEVSWNERGMWNIANYKITECEIVGNVYELTK